MDITLLIPTKNRSDFLIRQLRYYNDVGFKGTICIGDSSTAEHLVRTKRVITELQGNLSIVYGEYPDLNDYACTQKLLDQVSTAYAVCMPDDDFLVPSALEKCLRFLDKRPDYSATHGMARMFMLESTGPHGEFRSLFGWEQGVIEGESGSRRLIDHLKHYRGISQSVYRTDELKGMYWNASAISDRSFAGELLAGCLVVIRGKVKQLDCLYLVRQIHDRRYVFQDNFDWVTGPNWLPSYQLFRDRISKELVRQDGITVDEAREVVKEAFWSYLAQGLSLKWEQRYGRASTGYRQRLRRAARGVPGLRRTWNGFRTFLPGPNNRLSLPALLRRSSPYHADFMPIYRAITTPPGSRDGSIAGSEQQERSGVL